MSIRFKLIVPLLLMMAVFSVVFYLYILPSFKHNEVTRASKFHEQSMVGLATSLYPYVKEGDVDAMGQTLNAYKSFDSGVVNIVVTDIADNTLYQVSNIEAGGEYSQHTVKISRHNDHVGNINMVVYPRYYSGTEPEYLSAVGYLFIGLLVAIILLNVIAHNYFIKRPINRLLGAVNAIAYGDFDVEIVDTGKDEFGELSSSIKMMRNNIIAFQQSLKEKTVKANELAESLFESERRTKSIIDNVAHGIVVLNGKGDIESVNQALCDLLGYNEDELVGESIALLTPQAYRDEGGDFIYNYINTGVPEIIGKGVRELEVFKKNGDSVVADIAITEMSFGRDRYFNAVISDATERKEAEAKLRAERDRAQRYLDTVDVMMVALDPNGRVELINRKGCEVVGFSESEVVGALWAELCIRKKDIEKFNSFFRKQFEDIENFVDASESVLHSKSGEEHVISWRHSFLTNQEGATSGILCSGTDITEAKRVENERSIMQQQLQQSQKMQAIGQLTGGIAHDFNNIVASILGHTELLILKTSASSDEKVAQYLKNIYQSSERAKDLVGKMLAFSRGQEKEIPEPIIIESAIKDIINILRSVLPATISIGSSFESGVQAVLASHIDLQQIVMNLCINARDAMKGVGAIDIEVKKSPSEQCLCSSCHDEFRGDYVVLSVSDTGGGISSKDMNRLFEPFFTTKEVGKGTGMGLSVIHGIVHDLGGHIIVTNREGEGVTVDIYLKAADSVVNNIEPITQRREALSGAGRSVLVVDDEPLVREFVYELLTESDYKVMLSEGPMAALEIMNKERSNIDVIITDQSMPGMTGIQLSKNISSQFPDIPIVLCTGYRDDIPDEEIYSSGVKAVLNKPMKGEEILAILDKVMTLDGVELAGTA